MAAPPWRAVHGLGAGVWVGRARYAMRVGLLRKLAYAGQACGAGLRGGQHTSVRADVAMVFDSKPLAQRALAAVLAYILGRITRA